MSHDIIDNSSGIVKNLPIPRPEEPYLYRRENLTGRVYGRLTVVSLVSKSGRSVWLCSCVCGCTKNVKAECLKAGTTNSCGCLQKESRSQGHKTHGLSRSPLYRVWHGVLQRCNNVNNKSYSYYGGRGITVDPKWLTFSQFYEDMNKSYTKGLTLERVDNTKGYSKENCEWATLSEQGRNKRNNHTLTYKEQVLCLSEWCELLGINYDRTKARLNLGWTVEQAFELPLRSRPEITCKQ